MVLNSYYDYINVLAFKYLLKYENSKTISINKLKEFRKALLNVILDEYKERGNDCYPQEVDHWYGEVTFEKIDEDEELKNFIEDYSDIFHLKNNMVYVNDNITYEIIDNLETNLRVTNKIPFRINQVERSQKVMQVLGIHKIDEVLNNYLPLENKLEKLYGHLYSKNDNSFLRDEINKLINVRALFFVKLGLLPQERIDAFRIRTYELDTGDWEKTDYDKSPIDVNMWEKSDYYDEDDFLSDIDAEIYDIYQYAIFGGKKNKLSSSKIMQDLDNFYFFGQVQLKDEDFDVTQNFIDNEYFEEQEAFEKAVEEFERKAEENSNNVYTFHDPSDEEFIYYINYLNNLNNFMSIYGVSDDLLLAKKRLLYTLDTPQKKIYNEANFKNQLTLANEIEIDEDFMSYCQDEYHFLADEIFMTPTNEFTIRKLIMVGTYYNITKDKDIKKTIESHKNDSRYSLFREVIINNCLVDSKDDSFNKKGIQYFKKYHNTKNQQ